MAHVRLDNITKTFGGHTALKDFDLEIEDGEFFVLLGPTGAGKTTTLRLIAGLEQPDAGTIAIDHEDVRELECGGARRRAGVPAILPLSAVHGARRTSNFR